MEDAPRTPGESQPADSAETLNSAPRAFLSRVFGELQRDAPDLGKMPEIEASADWRDTLARCCRQVGIRADEIELSWEAAPEVVRPGVPLVTWTPRSGWLALLDSRGDRVLVLSGTESARWVDVNQFAAENDAGERPDSHAPWMVLEPGTPPGAVSSDEKLTPFRRLIEIVRPDRGDLYAIVLYAAFVGLLSLATPIAVQQLVNIVAFGGLVQPVIMLAVLLFMGLAFAGLLTVLQTHLAELIQRRVFVRTCIELSDRLPRVAPSSFDGHHGPELVNRFLDLTTVQKSGASLLLDGSTVALQSLTGLVVLSFYHPVMLGFSAVLVLSFAFVIFVLGRGATETAIGESYAKYAVAGWLEELARHPSTFRHGNGRAWAMKRADGLLASWVEARSSHYKILLRQIIGSTGLQVFISTLLLAIGGALVVAGQLTLGQLVASEIIVATVVAGFARLGKQLESYYDLLAATDKVGTLLDLSLESDLGRTPSETDGPASIEAHGVGAESQDGKVALDNLTLVVEPGERIAIEGPSSSGKSVLIDVLCGLRTPSTGYVALDGEDLRELRPEGVRDRVMCVREPEIFEGTIFENLRVGSPDASSEDLNEVLDQVGLLDELRMRPEGLQTRLSTNGWPLSRSMSSRIMLARTMLARPSVLILDGAFAHMDDECRRRASQAVLGPDAPWTALVVSQDPMVLSHCTRAFRLGRVGQDRATGVAAGTDFDTEGGGDD